MAVIEEHWNNLTEKQWQHLAKQFLLEIRQEVESGGDGRSWGEVVVNLGLWGPPECVWKFILLAISLAESDDELGVIAAGPIEHLLGRAGKDFIDCVEVEAGNHHKFAKAITYCLQYTMTDEIWTRVQKLQIKCRQD